MSTGWQNAPAANRFAAYRFKAALGFTFALGWLALVAAAFMGLASAQIEPRVVQADGRTFLDSQITLGTGYPAIANQSFVNTPVMPLSKGLVLPSRGVIGRLGMERMVSLRRHDFAIGSRTVAYPVVGLMRCSNFSDTGSFVKVIAATTVMKANAGTQPLHSGGYVLEAVQPIHAGASVPTVRVVFQEKSFLFSVEEAASKTGTALPLLSISPERATARDREVALEAWRLSNQSVREGNLQ